MGVGSWMNAMSRMSPPHPGHSSGNSSPTRAISFAQAILEASCERGFSRELQQPSAACPSPACPPVAALLCLPTFAFGQRRDGPPQRVIRRENAVLPVPVFSRWRHEIGEPVEELKQRQLECGTVGEWC